MTTTQTPYWLTTDAYAYLVDLAKQDKGDGSMDEVMGQALDGFIAKTGADRDEVQDYIGGALWGYTGPAN